MAKKSWGQLSKRTKARYAAQGVTAQRYNAANRRGLRGDARLQFLGVRPGSISDGGASVSSAFHALQQRLQEENNVVDTYVSKRFPQGHSIDWDAVRARVARQDAAMRRAIIRRDWDYVDAHDDPDDSLSWYHD